MPAWRPVETMMSSITSLLQRPVDTVSPQRTLGEKGSSVVTTRGVDGTDTS
jgi:hypothetical protein